MQRHCTLSFFFVFITLFATAQSLRFDEHASKVALKGSAYEVSLVVSAKQQVQPARAELDVIDPSGATVGTSSFPVNLNRGTNTRRSTIRLTKLPKQSEDLLWYRLVCSITANGEEIGRDVLPLFGSAEDFSLHVSAPFLVQPGRKFFVRVHTNNPVLATPVSGVAVKVVVDNIGSSAMASAIGTTSPNGYVVIPLTVPTKADGHEVELSVEARRGAITKKAENDLKLGAPAQILVQTDKPLYQPGQTLHVRALVFGDEHRALTHKKIYLQIEDEDGTVVFRDERYSSRFGVVSADWNIPDRLKLGEYGISAKTYPGRYVEEDDGSDDDENAVTSAMDRRVVRISRYELPTFVVNAKPDRSYYLPDQKASVEISAAYLFGKPVPKASVRISRLEQRRWNFAKQKWEVDEGEPVSGVTDEQGTFHSILDIANEFSDLDDESYRKFRDITYTAYVSDPTTGRTEERRFDLRVSKHPIHVYFVGNDASKKGLPEEFFVSTSYADGSPAQCEVEVRTVEGTGERLLASVHTNRYGVARVRNAKGVQPVRNEIPLVLVARDHKGASGISKQNIWQYGSNHYTNVSTNKTILAVGDPIEAEVHSDVDGGVIVELVNESRILRSSTARIKNHSAFVRFPYSPEFKGQLSVVALNLNGGRWTSTAASSRSVIYPENRDLKVSLKLDQNEYRPGQPASATVQVKTAVGAPIPSVVGAVIFDKAVEERARIDEDLREPFGFGGYGGWWYRGAKLANLTRADLDRVDTSEPVSDDLEIAADFLLNANGYGTGMLYAPTFGDDEPDDPANVYKPEILKTLAPVTVAIYDEVNKAGTLPRNADEFKALLERHHLNWADFKDPWDMPFIPKFSISYLNYELELFSPGPDKMSNTDDDFSATSYSVNIYQATQQMVTKALKEYHAKTGKYVREIAALREAMDLVGLDLSKVTDPWGRPYLFDFGIKGAQYTVMAKTLGSDAKPGGYEYVVGTSAIDYFEEPRAEITRLLNPRVQAAGKTPESGEEFKKLLLPEFRIDDLRDPYGRPYIVRLSAVASYTDKFAANSDKVSTEPVTIWNRLINIRSMGPDGVADTDDDFDVATFATMISEVTTSGQVSKPTVHLMFTGETGGIMGTVLDQSGAIIPNAKVVATNLNTKTEYQTTSDSQGKYLLLNIPPGVYNLSISASGFQMSTSRGVVVLAQEAIEINTTLRIGSTTETVTVEATAAGSIQTDSGEASVKQESSTTLAQQATVTPRLREYFPETLLWQPSVETDPNGRAHINWKFADNLTTWKLSLIASTADGRLATLDKEVKSFQPFFVEHDPPKALTVGDRISLPVVIRNYTEKSQRVKVEMPEGQWFRSSSGAVQEAVLSPGGNAKLIFPFEATSTTAAGKQRVIATGATVADAIERPVAVHPDGAELTRTDGRIISGTATLDLDIPAEAIPGSVHADLKIYPNLLAQVAESLEGMLERPYGCGEQTISSTYPSVLLLKFEKESKRSLGPLHDRALRYANLGYTRLLSYFDESGGLTYWGRGEPDLALTAYAIRFLADASEFVPVDPSLVDHARKWLVSKQLKNGSWASEHWYEHSPVQDAILTAYVAQGLALTQAVKDGDQKTLASEGASIRRALDYVAAATRNYSDPYLVASYGLAEVYSREPARAENAIAQLRASAEKEQAGTHWELHANTPFYGWGHAGRVETTALAVQLLDRAGHAEDKDLVMRGLEFLIEQKDGYGAWYSTQTTVNVIQALLLLASRETVGTPVPLQILVNGVLQPLPSNNEQIIGPQVLDISQSSHPGKNTIVISGGSGKLTTAQMVADYYVRWDSSLATPKAGPLKLSVACDRTHLQVGEKDACKVKVERTGSAGHGMMIAEIGIPPGVDVDREALQKNVSESGWELSSFDVLPDRIVAYVWPRAGGTEFTVTFTPRMAVDAVSAPHSLYDYYNPDASVTAKPDRFLVVEAAPVAQR
jgi:hypothetical protein